MTLSEEQIIDLFNEACRETFNGLERFRNFARAIEAEVRKRDDTLILQLVEALNECKDSTQERIDALAASGMDKHRPIYFRTYVLDLKHANEVITAGRARLEGKP